MAMVLQIIIVGYKVKIPAIFINFKMGQKLVSLIEKTKIVTMKIAF